MILTKVLIVIPKVTAKKCQQISTKPQRQEDKKKVTKDDKTGMKQFTKRKYEINL